jgi:hypothetical protein
MASERFLLQFTGWFESLSTNGREVVSHQGLKELSARSDWYQGWLSIGIVQRGGQGASESIGK